MVTRENLKRVITDELEGRNIKIMKSIRGIHALIGEARGRGEGGGRPVFDLHLERDSSSDDPDSDLDEGQAPEQPDEAEGGQGGAGPVPPAGPAAAPPPAVVYYWPSTNHFHRIGPGGGQAWGTPLGFVIPKTLTLRTALFYYLNGDSSLKMKPMMLMERKDVISLIEKNWLSLMHKFFGRMRRDVLVGDSQYKVATRTTRVPLAEMEGLLGNLNAVLMRPPYSYIRMHTGLAREGFAGNRAGMRAAQAPDRVDSPFASLATYITCASIVRRGSVEDKAELVTRRGCGRDNNGKQCKSCREYIASIEG